MLMASDATKDVLLSLIRQQEAAADPQDQADPFDASLVRLQPEGKKRPFFCVHPASGTVAVFFDVARMIDAERPFFAFQPPGLDGERDPFFDLRALASGYVRQIRKVQPSGPYTFGGWSAGGLIAFQMAHELRASGEEVALLVLCDTVNSELFPTLPYTRQELTAFVHQQMAMMVAHLAKQRGTELDASTVFDRIQSIKRVSLRGRADLIFDLLEEVGAFRSTDARLIKVFRKVYRANLAAVARYDVPEEPLDATITLLRCKNEESVLKLVEANDTYGWTPRTTRPVDVIDMPCHHFALFQGDVAPITARTLRRLLDAADRP
jgi:thioesterase domain-containing protein